MTKKEKLQLWLANNQGDVVAAEEWREALVEFVDRELNYCESTWVMTCQHCKRPINKCDSNHLDHACLNQRIWKVDDDLNAVKFGVWATAITLFIHVLLQLL